MDFIQTANKQVDKFGPGKHGFSAGNSSGGIPATFVSQEWCDNVQQELINVIEGAGLTVNPASKTQLYQAILAMISGNAANGYKASVRAATTANIANLAGGAPNTLDGVTLVANDRILVKDQTAGSQNGIYVVTTLGTGANGTWTRATDADGVGELTSGAVVAVEEGATNADAQLMLTTNGAITIGTTPLAFVRKDVPPGSLVSSGYQKLPGGLIFQWGLVTTGAGVPGSVAVTFPIAFPTLCASVITTRTDAASSSANTVSNASGVSTTGFTAWASTSPALVNWISIGF